MYRFKSRALYPRILNFACLIIYLLYTFSINYNIITMRKRVNQTVYLFMVIYGRQAQIRAMYDTVIQ